MKVRSTIVIGGIAVTAGSMVVLSVSAVVVAVLTVRKVHSDVTYAARDGQLRLLEQAMADDKLRQAIWPGMTVEHLYLNAWVMHHHMTLTTGLLTWQQFNAYAGGLLGTPAGQKYWQEAGPHFAQHRTSRFGRRFVAALEAAAGSRAEHR